MTYSRRRGSICVGTPYRGNLAGGGQWRLNTFTYLGPIDVTYRACDPSGKCSNEATLTINVQNHVPFVQGLVVDAKAGRKLNLNPVIVDADNDFGKDLDDLTLNFIPVGDANLNGFLDPNGFNPPAPNPNTYSYTPNVGFSGTVEYTLVVNDGHVDAPPVDIVINVTIDSSVSQPEAVDSLIDMLGAVAGDQKIIPLIASDDDGDVLSFELVDPPSQGSVIFTGVTPNEVEYTHSPNAGFAGRDSFTFTATDGYWVSNIAQVTINISNQAPVALDTFVTFKRDSDNNLLDLLAYDPDGNPLTTEFEFLNTPTDPLDTDPGLLFQDSDGLWNYRPPAGFLGKKLFRYKVFDGIDESLWANLEITVAEDVNPPIGENDFVIVNEYQLTSIFLIATDPEGDILEYSIIEGPSHGEGTIVKDPIFGRNTNEVHYTGFINYSGRDSFTFKVTDGMFESVARVDILVSKINDVSTVQPITVVMNENTTAQITLDGFDPDIPDQGNLNYDVDSSDAPGRAIVNGDTLLYTPPPGFNSLAPVVMTYTASDGELESAPAVVIITVNGVNDLPVAVDSAVTSREEVEIEITLKATDPEGNPLTFQIWRDPALGNEISIPDINVGTALYTPGLDFFGQDSFEFEVSDGQATSRATVTINVTPVSERTVDCQPDDISHLIDLPRPVGLDPAHPWDVKYVDNLITVSMAQEATDLEKQLLLDVSPLDLVEIVCSIVQEPLTIEEAGETDPIGTGYATYTIRVEDPPRDLDTLIDLAELIVNTHGFDPVTGVGFVEEAAAILMETDVPDYSAQTDAEAYASQFFDRSLEVGLYNHQFQGVLEYLRAFKEQRDFNRAVTVAIADTGVCAKLSHRPACVSLGRTEGVAAKLEDVTRPGPDRFIGDKKIGIITDDFFGFLDTTGHGSIVATVLAAKSGGNITEPDFGQIDPPTPRSGILGSVFGLDYHLISYNTGTLPPYLRDLLDSRNKFYKSDALADMCDFDVSNNSYGITKKAFDTYSIKRQSNLYSQATRVRDARRHCSGTLYVSSAGNDGVNLDTSGELFASYKLKSSGVTPNSVIVQASEDLYDTMRINDRGLLSILGFARPGSNFGSSGGSSVPIAVGMANTSLAAPVVTGTAALMKAVNNSLGPVSIKNILIRTGDVFGNTSYVDMVAAILVAIHKKGNFGDYIPLTTKTMDFSKVEELDDLRSGDRGVYVETSNWKVSGGELGYNFSQRQHALASADESRYEVFYTGQRHFLLDFSVRNIEIPNPDLYPFMTVFPSSFSQPGGVPETSRQKDSLFGNYELQGNPDFNESFSSKYCAELGYDVNETGSGSNGFHIPLARNTGTFNLGFGPLPFSLEFTGLTFKANMEKYRSSYVPSFISRPSSGPPDLLNFKELCQPASNDLDITASTAPDNDQAFEAWVDSVNQIVWWDLVQNKPQGEACGLCYCMARAVDPENLKLYVEVAFSNFQCELSTASTNTYLTPELGTALTPPWRGITVDDKGDVTIKVGGGGEELVQTFLLEMDTAGGNNCLTTVDITIKGLYDNVYKGLPTGFVTNANLFKLGEPICGDTFHVTASDQVSGLEGRKLISWNLNAGEFPADGLLDAINSLLPLLFDEHSIGGNVRRLLREGKFSLSFINSRAHPLIMATPHFGAGTQTWHWAHGIGPVQAQGNRSDTQRRFKLISVDKLDRTVVP